MDFNTYQTLAMRTDPDEAYVNGSNPMSNERLLNGLMGLNGEAGEAIEILKKFFFQGHSLNYDRITEEIGDALWYITLCAKAMGKTLEDIARYNIEKLEKRFPNGFSTERSVHRQEEHCGEEGDRKCPYG